MNDSSDDLRSWDAAAAHYASMVGTADDSFWRRFEPFLSRYAPSGKGRVLDAGCGHGWLADHLAVRGAEVVGVDGSAELVEQARRRRPDLRFETYDLTLGLPPGVKGPFDLVVAHMVLMDMPSISALLRDVAKALAPGGVLVTTMLHPSFFNQEPVAEPFRHRQVTGYLEHQEWWIESFGGHRHYHRALAWYVQQFRDAGLAIVDMDEPASLPTHRGFEADWSEHERWFANIPTMLSLAAAHRANGEARS